MAEINKNRGLPSGPRFFTNSFIFLILSLLSAGVNYAYYPAIAHFLAPSQFGAIQALIAILLQLGAIFSGLNLVTIYLVHKLDQTTATKSIEVLQKITTSIFILATLLVVIGQNSLLHFLQLDNRTYIFIVGLDLITSIPFVMAFGHLQAKRHFAEAGLLQLMVVTTKLVLGVVAAKKFGASGALAGIALGQVFGMLLFWIVSSLTSIKIWSHKVTTSLLPPGRSELKLLRPIAGNVVAIFLVNVLVALFISFDIIAARHFFAPSISGLYSGASTITNAIVFVCLPLIAVLLPHLDRRSLANNRPLLLKTASMVMVISLVSVLFFRLFPNGLLRIFGQPYVQLNYLLWRLGILMSLVAGITLVSQVSAFYAPLRTALILAVGVVSLAVAAATHHASLTNFVSAIMLVFSIMLIAGVGQIIWVYNHGQKN